ncbi:tripartite motif-containing protein 29 [Onychomys torridus]|uniref:tripartite motif-containing protein 29 n=1 Tax=Onychomys torridus TaxID=38674 RepID=UPI00167FB74D|nr:tripartite motif-containing protein 29 [Onychomys torridus]
MDRAWGRVPVLPTLQIRSRSYEQVYSCACLDRVCAGGNASSCLQHKACVMLQKRCIGLLLQATPWQDSAGLDWVQILSFTHGPRPTERSKSLPPFIRWEGSRRLSPYNNLAKPLSSSGPRVHKYGVGRIAGFLAIGTEPSRSGTELSLQKEQLQLKIIEIEDEAEKWQKEKDRIKSFTTNEKAILEQNFRDLVRDLEKQKEEVRAALEQREQDAVDQVKVIVDALDERAKVLHDDKQTREQLHSISDSVLFLQEFGALMSNYSLPPPLPTYHVLLEGEGLGQSLGNFKDDLLNVCMRHVEKMCKADLSRNFIERNHMENGGDHRYMNSYTSSYGNEWSTPDTMKRYSMYLTPKGGGRTSYQPSSPSRLSKETSQKNFNNLYGTKGNYTSRVWEYSSTVQNSEDLPTVQGNSSFSLKGYPSILRSQASKAQPQTWKSGKQTLLSHYRPFYVNKGSGMGSNEAP